MLCQFHLIPLDNITYFFLKTLKWEIYKYSYVSFHIDLSSCVQTELKSYKTDMNNK